MTDQYFVDPNVFVYTEAKTNPSAAATEASQVKRIGFMEGEFEVPDDFDQMGSDEIEEMFSSEPIPARLSRFDSGG